MPSTPASRCRQGIETDAGRDMAGLTGLAEQPDRRRKQQEEIEIGEGGIQLQCHIQLRRQHRPKLLGARLRQGRIIQNARRMDDAAQGRQPGDPCRPGGWIGQIACLQPNRCAGRAQFRYPVRLGGGSAGQQQMARASANQPFRREPSQATERAGDQDPGFGRDHGCVAFCRNPEDGHQALARHEHHFRFHCQSFSRFVVGRRRCSGPPVPAVPGAVSASCPKAPPRPDQ